MMKEQIDFTCKIDLFFHHFAVCFNHKYVNVSKNNDFVGIYRLSMNIRAFYKAFTQTRSGCFLPTTSRSSCPTGC